MGIKILIIEDDVKISQDIEYFFKKKGFEVSIINKSADAFNIIQNINSFDIVLLDIMMFLGNTEYKIDNLETGEIIYTKIREINNNIPIIISSAKDLNTMHIDFKSKENILFLEKPIIHEQLMTLIDDVKGMCLE